MGFLDNAKTKISNTFAEETVKEVHYNDDAEKPVSKPKQKKERTPIKIGETPIKPNKPEAQKRPPKSKNTKERVNKNKLRENPRSIESPKRPPRPVKSATPKKMQTNDEFYQEEEIEKYNELVPASSQGNSFKDVLEVLDIPETFAIESNVFLPEDIHHVAFDVQTPYGYEQGQVEAFVEQTRVTTKRYVELLKLRNEHVAKLATVVDRLQVDLNNIKYENEIASGINIMATADDDLENQYLEAKLKIKRLEDIINENQMETTNESKEKINNLKDQVSLLNRENNELTEENFELKNRIAMLMENQDYDVKREEVESSFFEEEEEIDENNFALPSIEIIDDNSDIGALPSLDDDDDDEDEVDKLMKNWK